VRLIDEWTGRVKATGDTIRVYVMHLKAGDTQADADERAQQIAQLGSYYISNLPRVDKVIYAGDMNVYSSDESAYSQLIYSTEGGLAADPINRPGNWHNNLKFADIHTQSPRVRQFGGGANGGLDDRFDQILLSRDLLSHYIAASYTAYGNDGNHFNDSINAMPNLAVPQETAQALHDASDHLPVYLDLVFGATSGVQQDEPQPAKEMDLSERR
jgi:exonuclease III